MRPAVRQHQENACTLSLTKGEKKTGGTRTRDGAIELKSLFPIFFLRFFIIQRVPALLAFWDLEKTVLGEIRVSGTVL